MWPVYLISFLIINVIHGRIYRRQLKRYIISRGSPVFGGYLMFYFYVNILTAMSAVYQKHKHVCLSTLSEFTE